MSTLPNEVLLATDGSKGAVHRSRTARRSFMPVPLLEGLPKAWGGPSGRPCFPSTGGPRPLAGYLGGAALGGQAGLDPVLLAFLVVVDVLVA